MQKLKNGDGCHRRSNSANRGLFHSFKKVTFFDIAN